MATTSAYAEFLPMIMGDGGGDGKLRLIRGGGGDLPCPKDSNLPVSGIERLRV